MPTSKKLPRNEKLPTPPMKKLGKDPAYREVPIEQVAAHLSGKSQTELITLIIKGANAGAFSIFQSVARKGLAGADDPGGTEVDEINNWPPKALGARKGGKKSAAKKPAAKTAKKSAKKATKKAAKKR